MGANAREDDGRTDRFGDVVYRPKTEALRLVLDLGFGGDEDYRNAPRPFISLELAADFITVHFRHHDVQKNQGGCWITLRDLERLGAVQGDLDLIMLAQDPCQHVNILRSVIDDQNDRVVRRRVARVSLSIKRSDRNSRWWYRPRAIVAKRTHATGAWLGAGPRVCSQNRIRGGEDGSAVAVGSWLEGRSDLRANLCQSASIGGHSALLWPKLSFNFGASALE